MAQYKIDVKEHRTTGLLMALSDDLPGFVVHAHTEDELLAKIGPAFESFMRATGNPVRNVEVHRENAAPGFWPPAFIATGSLDKAA